MGISIDNTGLWGPGNTEARIRTRAGMTIKMDLRGAGKNEHNFALNIFEIVLIIRYCGARPIQMLGYGWRDPAWNQWAPVTLDRTSASTPSDPGSDIGLDPPLTLDRACLDSKLASNCHAAGQALDRWPNRAPGKNWRAFSRRVPRAC